VATFLILKLEFKILVFCKFKTNYLIGMLVIFVIFGMCIMICEPGNSVSILSGYGLDDRAFEVRSSAEAKGFFL
jgi:hypothetical protein